MFFNLNSTLLMLELQSDYRGDLSLGIFFYAALLVSAWAWLYAVSALLTRFIVRLWPNLMTKTVWFLDVDSHPIRSLGCIAGVIVFVLILALRELARL
jgi:hypothetical protein